MCELMDGKDEYPSVEELDQNVVEIPLRVSNVCKQCEMESSAFCVYLLQISLFVFSSIDLRDQIMNTFGASTITVRLSSRKEYNVAEEIDLDDSPCRRRQLSCR